MALAQPASVVTDTPLSRASSLPQGLCLALRDFAISAS
ncbi:hypothetical protein [Pseudomonas sp. FG-3G]|nr:hypothetical protein [Pseudomonas sp. FG-3G]